MKSKSKPKVSGGKVVTAKAAGSGKKPPTDLPPIMAGTTKMATAPSTASPKVPPKLLQVKTNKPLPWPVPKKSRPR